MSKDPAFLFYSSDFISGVSDLTMEERGQYITLLCLQHQKGGLTEKTICLSVGSVSVDVLKKFCKDENGNFFNKRLVEEIEKRNSYTESRRNNGLKGGRPKNNTKPKKNHKVKHMDNHMEDENEDVNKDKKEDINKTPLEKKFDDFLNYRKKINHPVKDVSLEALKKRLWKLSGQNIENAIQILEDSIANGYIGIFELKNNNNGKQSVITNNKSVREEILTRDYDNITKRYSEAQPKN